MIQSLFWYTLENSDTIFDHNAEFNQEHSRRALNCSPERFKESCQESELKYF